MLNRLKKCHLRMLCSPNTQTIEPMGPSDVADITNRDKGSCLYEELTELLIV